METRIIKIEENEHSVIKHIEVEYEGKTYTVKKVTNKNITDKILYVPYILKYNDKSLIENKTK